MNKNRNNIFISLIIILYSLIISGCYDGDVDSVYSFEVISSDDGFVGYYILDTGSAKEFSSSPLDSSSIYYSYDKDLSSPESILISVTGSSTTTSSISIYIYDNNELADSVTISQSDSDVKISGSLSYTFGDCDSSSDE